MTEKHTDVGGKINVETSENKSNRLDNLISQRII
jgi:hypothetical protein